MQKIEKTNIDIIKKIYNQSFEKPWTDNDFATLLDNQNNYGLMLDDVAFILLQTFDGEAEIITIAVNKDYRRQGLAKKLIDAVKKEFKKIYLEVNERNVPAISLYASCGFVKTGIRKKYYNNKDDAIMMQWG